MLRLLLISIIEGIVISAPANPNLDDAVQVSVRNASNTQNNRTAYVEAFDGSRGWKLVFQHYDPGARQMKRYARVKVDVSQAVISDDGRVIREIPNDAVISVEPGKAADVPLKERTVRTLTDDDLYTWVTLKDCEFVFKDGSYCNILESYAARPFDNKALGGNGYMGTWQTLLTDSDAAPVYAVINSRVPWRRSGRGVPQGKGDFSGIYVRSDISRYGKVFAPQIRPLAESNFDFEWDGESSFKTICGWTWNDNADEFITTEGPFHYIKRHHVPAETGEGEIYVDFEASTYRGRDCNNPSVEPDDGYVLGSRGQVVKGSMQVRTMCKNWWNWQDDCGNSLVVKFSTEDITGDRLALAFSFAAGDNDAANTRMCPVYWGVEVSTDNVHIARVDIPDITLRPLPWWAKKLDGVQYYTSAEAGMGLTEHLVVLPSYLFGQKEVYVRISPVRKNAYTLAMYGSDKACIRPNDNNWTFIEFGSVKVIYK